MKTSEINRAILRLSIPNMISNMVIPLLGMVDTAIAGRIGGDLNIAALSVGTTIFNFIYWNCSFLRMGTSGITAQAYGAGRKKECAGTLVRSVWLALAIAFLLLIFQEPVGRFSLYVMQGSDQVRTPAAEYLFARIWAVPASITLFAIQGWFIGMQDAKTPMMIAIMAVIINAVFSLYFAFCLDMGIAGIAWGSVVAQYSSLLITCILWFAKYREYLGYFDIKESFSLQPVIRFLHINKDIFIRSACVVVVYTFFTAASARFGDTILATNALLMQLFTLFSYMSDGFAYAAESLSGRFVGERNGRLLKRFINKLLFWAIATALLSVLIYLFSWREILLIFSPSEEILDSAGKFIGWIIAVPLAGCIPFMIDGIMIGATKTKLLRNTVFISTILFFTSFYALLPLLGNTALWTAFLIFLLSRGLLLYFGSGRLNIKKIMDA
ncbi:MAG: MATE family efflux transporter [Tannerella sp.]|jgi:MATE family multidrug resistance protein|nr:MATE family efflux transporter [Tannerella sp.]